MVSESPDVPSREELIALNQAQAAQIAALMARVAELERRLGLNSSNSGKPPSSDGMKKPARVASLRERSNKKPGGQKGHEGETLRQSADPDAIVDHFPSICSGCGGALTRGMAHDHAARQVHDLPEPRPLVVTEHRAHVCQCAGCGARTRGAFPDGVNAPVQYGARIAAFAIYLTHQQMLPQKRLVALMADLFGVRIAAATIEGMSRACAARLKGFSETVRGLVAGAPVKHMDETGFRIGGKTQWLHVACTVLLTFYRTCAKRGSLLAGVAGIVVHDHWKPYYTMTGVLHALCNAHHLRELKALVEIEKEDWARQMQRLLRRACHAANLARDAGVALKPGLVACIERRGRGWRRDRLCATIVASGAPNPPSRSRRAPSTREGDARYTARAARRSSCNRASSGRARQSPRRRRAGSRVWRTCDRTSAGPCRPRAAIASCRRCESRSRPCV